MTAVRILFVYKQMVFVGEGGLPPTEILTPEESKSDGLQRLMSGLGQESLIGEAEFLIVDDDGVFWHRCSVGDLFIAPGFCWENSKKVLARLESEKNIPQKIRDILA